MTIFKTLISLSLFLLVACGRPPSGGGGRPEGDFPVNVVGAPVVSTSLQETVRLVGGFVAPEDIQVVSRIAAEIHELPFAQGAAVEKGDLLVAFDEARLLARKQEIEARLNLAEQTFNRNVRLRESNTVTDQELEVSQAELAQAKANLALVEEELKDTRIHAPFAGRLGERRVSVGQVVQPGQILLHLVQMDPLDIRFEVPERYLAALTDGLTVNVESDAFPDETFSGEVVFVSPEVRASSRTVAVRARVENPEGRLRPGMFGRVGLVLEERPEALVVPETAVMQQGRETVVLARNEEGRAERRVVRTGIRLGGRVEIREGLSEGDVVVVEGQMKARPGMLLNFTERSARYDLDLEEVAPPEDELDEDGTDADPPDDVPEAGSEVEPESEIEAES
ncbi:MAG: efflux RND transporter periplasmic adaptor subunit [Verrucomicrobia bacterium]|nr:efflux RND transporter periplasmic adaptor subunit [Verrucomicrobiota bacterium]MCH8510937.1 efflux RND transporter periplasmic adaptor subunit [Kiritimatiellia bacterium]